MVEIVYSYYDVCSPLITIIIIQYSVDKFQLI